MSYGGSVFDFYNRIDRPEWARVRDELEDWYRHYRNDSEKLRTDFRSPDNDQHFATWWELYVYTFYRLLGYEITVEPTLPNGKKPDFLITRDGVGAYVECKAVVERSVSALEASILECTDKASHPDFVVELDIEQEGSLQPAVAKIRTPLEKWLQELNADDVIDDLEAGKPLPTLPLEIDGDWQLLYTAWPVPPEQRGKYTRLLGMHSARVMWNDSVGLIKRAVKDKGSKYTDVDTPLDHPLIVALNTATVFIDDDEVDQALFGARSTLWNPHGEPRFTPLGRRTNGYWCGDPPKGTRVSGVLLGRNIDPYGAARATPRMWINPWPQVPISETYGLTTNTLQDDEQVLRTDGDLVIHELFDLPENWPLVDKQRR
ncbi:hypothetical protein AWB95_17720 [Mycobacterium celatum]|uniref:Uncharacterized protein n=2 Tax=Mycobacterium celatum TaxID=28045 RepID=A0A1X1RM88_MYCCE|nr:hypothetical protein AWB95_17720 [Mycobacterium celatum]PIB75660.1 hypothetical protein CQY23_19570 [Mycobacterium celatum]